MRKSAKKVLAAAAVATLMGYSARAATLNWDADGVAPVNGGSGIWDTINPLWEDGLGGYTTWSNANPDNAVLAGSVGTVTLGEAITAGTLTVNTNFYVVDLNNNNLTVNGSTSGTGAGFLNVTNSGGTTATFDAGSFSSGAVNVTGNLNLTLRAGWTPVRVNDFTGTFTFAPSATATILPTNANGLGSATGQIVVDATTAQANINWSSPDGTQFHTYTRDVQLIHGVGIVSRFQVNGVKQVTLSGVISGGDGTTGLQWAGSNQGNLVLAGDNTYTGVTTLSGQSNMLTIAHNNALGNTSGVTLASTLQTLAFANNIDLANTNAVSIQSSSGIANSGYGHVHNMDGDNTFSGNVTWTGSTLKFIGAEAGSELQLNGVLGGVGAGGFTKVGYGTVVLTGPSIYGNSNAGAAQNETTLNQGTLRLDFSQATITEDIINNPSGNSTSFSLTNNRSSELGLGGGTLEVVGMPEATNVQRFRNASSTATRSLNLTLGASAVRAVQNDATSLTINLGKLRHADRGVGGTVDFTLPSAGAIELPRADALNVGTNGAILIANGAAFATVDGSDWAALDDLGNRTIVAGSTLTGFYTANDASTLAGNADMSGGVDTTLAADTTITSLRFNDAAARTIDATGQTLSTGGILVTSAVGNNVSTITGGTLRGADNPAGTTLQDLIVIQNNTANKLVISSTIADAANTGATALTKTGPGTLELTAANTYTGITALTGGTLKLEHATAIPGGIDSAGGTANLVFEGGVIGLTANSGDFRRGIGTGAAQAQFSGDGGFAAYGGTGVVNIGGALGSVTFGSNPTAGTFVQTGSALVLGADDADGTVDFQNPISLRSPNAPQQREFRVFNGSAAVDGLLSGVVSGDGGLTKTGAGTLELSQTNTYIGPTMAKEGTLLISGALIGAGSGPTVGPMSIGSGAEVVWNRATNTTFLGVISGTGSLTKLGANTLVLRGTNTFTGATTISEGALQIGHGSTSGSFIGDILNNASLVFNKSNTLTYPGDVSGTGSVTKIGAGTLILTGNSSYSGGTTINVGTVEFSALNNLGSGDITFTGGTLQHATGSSADISSRTVTIGTAGGTIDTNGNDVTYANAIGNNGGGALTKSGAGTLTLLGANTHSGTTISGGIVAVAADAALGSGSVTLNGGNNTGLQHTASYSTARSVVVATGAGGGVAVDAGVTATYTTAITGSGNGTFRKFGDGTLVVPGLDLTTGALSVQAGVLQVPSSATPSTSVVGSIGVTAGAGQFDMGNNAAVVRGQTVVDLNAEVKDGRNGGTWDGNGIMTSRPDATALITGIAVNSADKALGITGTDTALFGGVTVGPTDSLVAYTFVGDATLDGAIDGDDFAAIDAGFSAAATLYGDGDFDYSGTIDADDYWLIDRNYSKQFTVTLTPSAPVAGAAVDGVTAVPEPGSIAVLGLAALGTMRRRRRQG